MSSPNGRAEPSRLAQAIVEKLGAGLASSEEVFAAFAELDALPPEVVRKAMDPWVGPAPDPERLDDATRRAHGLPPRRLVLKTHAIARDADLFDLGPIAEAQLKIAGKSWDGLDLPAEERLDGEVEGSFAGTLVRRVLGDGQTPRYDVLTFADGAGVVFRADTTDVLAFIADGRVETRDRQLREAVEASLAQDEVAPREPAREVAKAEPAAVDVVQEAAVEADDHDETADEAEVVAAPVKKRAAAKKTAAKKTAAKKTAATAKEPAAKVTAKKSAAKKTTAKTTAKATTAKKTAAKKTAKKTAAKKTARS